jgi:tRNA dimethylallyltransferase
MQYFIVGPTASGKHKIAIEVAKKLGACIISVDSMKVYREMNIGTCKPTQKERQEVRHYLIDIADPSEVYNAGKFFHDATLSHDEVKNSGGVPLFVGGTFLYYKVYVYGMFEGPSASDRIRSRLIRLANEKGSEYLSKKLRKVDPEAAKRINPNDSKRIIRALEVFELTKQPISRLQTHFKSPRFKTKSICLMRSRPDLYKRAERRLDIMLKKGLVDEVERLFKRDKGLGREARNAIGYKELWGYIQGDYNLEEARERILKRTYLFIRKQFTWIRSLKELIIINVEPDESQKSITERVLKTLEDPQVI